MRQWSILREQSWRGNAPVYVDVAVRRWQAFSGRKAIRLSDGQAFDAGASTKETG
jgi:hypothetical protein